MHNSSQHIPANRLDELLRLHLLKSSEEEKTKKTFDIQSEFVFSQSATDEKLQAFEKSFVEKLAKETGYISSGFNRNFFTWLFSSLFILAIILFLWKSLMTNGNVVVASQISRRDFSKQNSSIIHKEKQAEKSIKKLIITNNHHEQKTIIAQPKTKQNYNAENDFIFGNSDFPFKQPSIVNRKNNDALYLNLDFENTAPGTTNLPDVWYAGDGGIIGKNIYSIGIDTIIKYSGGKSLRMQNYTENQDGRVFGCLTNSIPLKYFKGIDSITISAYIKTENVKTYAYIWCSEWDGKPLHHAIKYANSMSQGGKGTSEWKYVKISLPIDSSATSLTFGGVLSTTGTVWFDKFEISIDDEKIEDVTPATKIPEITEIDWLNKNCFPITTRHTEDNFNDLTGLNEIINNAQVVALGGSSFGNHDELLIKQRVSEYLISEKKFNTICIDAGMPEVSALNDYILGVKEIKTPLLDSLKAKPYNCKEMQNFIEWMRKYNQVNNEKIMLYGIDMYYFEKSYHILYDFAKANDNKLLKELRELENLYSEETNKINKTRKKSSDAYYYKQLRLVKKINPCIDKIAVYFENNKQNYLKTISSEQFEWYKQQFALLKQKFPTDMFAKYSSFEKYSAENIQWILKQHPNSKIIILSANRNVVKNNDWTTVGKVLSDSLKDKFVTIGFATDSGTYTTYKDSILSVQPITPSAEGSFEYYFKHCKYPDFILSLKNIAGNDAQAKWLREQMYFRVLWDTYSNKQFYRKNLMDFDAIIFLRNTTHSENFNIGKKMGR